MKKLSLIAILFLSMGCSTYSGYTKDLDNHGGRYSGSDGITYVNYECFKVQGPLSSGTYKEGEITRLQVEQKDTKSLYELNQRENRGLYLDPYDKIPPHFECREVIKGSYRLDGNEK
jgi:hypothetical protein